MTSNVDYDVVVVGAGIAGIGAAYRIMERCPHLSMCVLESRHEVGGTWSLFQYPGIRSDSDLYTYSLPWHVWKGQSIASGGDILSYLKQAAAAKGIDAAIKLNRRLDAMDWSSESKTWLLQIQNTLEARQQHLRCRYVLLATGYYDYDSPLKAELPGINTFHGPVIHPQFWPKDADYKDKHVVVIGSGATAITLVPTLGKDAAHVTMLQRSPTYIASIPSESWLLQWILFMLFFVRFCRSFPRLSWALLLLRTQIELPLFTTLSPNFTPKYNPFDQNLCLTPNSHLFEALRKGEISIKTGNIEQITPKSIKLTSGAELTPDIIVTATGLRLSFGGKVMVRVDGKPFHIPAHHVWKGCMLDGLPNCITILGYFDASWTLGTDLSAKMACRLLNYAKRTKKKSFTPRSSPNMKPVPFTYLNATYVTIADSITPKAGDLPQWRPRPPYWKEVVETWWGDITTDMDWDT